MKSEFNLKINPEILKVLELKAKESNQDLESFVQSILGKYINNEKIFDSSQSSTEQNNDKEKSKLR